MSFNRRQFLRSIFYAGTAAVAAPKALVQVAVGFDQKPGGGIVTKFDRYDEWWAKHHGVASDISPDEMRLLDKALSDRLAFDAFSCFMRTKIREEGCQLVLPREIHNERIDSYPSSPEALSYKGPWPRGIIKAQCLGPILSNRGDVFSLGAFGLKEEEIF